MSEIPKNFCVNFELDYIDHTNDSFIHNKIIQYLENRPRSFIKAVSVSLTKENTYLVVAVVEFLKE